MADDDDFIYVDNEHGDANTLRVISQDSERWAKVSEWLLDMDISSNAVHLYAVLLAKFADRNTSTCYPSRDTIADAMGTSRSTVDRAMSELQHLRVVKITRRKTRKNEWTSSLYFVATSDPRGRLDVAPPATGPSTTGGEQSRIIDPEKDLRRSPSANDAEQTKMTDRPATERFPDGPPLRLCLYFHQQLMVACPSMKPPTISKKWFDEAERMLRLDARPKPEIRETIDWIFTNPAGNFWIANCQAIPTLRRQYDKIRAQMDYAAQQTRTASRGVQQQPQGAPVQFGTDGKVTEAYVAWEHENLRAIKADMIDEIGEAGIEEARAADRLPPWWDDV